VRLIKILPVSSELYSEVVRIQNPIWPEFATDENELHHRATLDPTLRSQHWLANRNGEPVGLLEIGPVSGSYHPQRWTIDISVEAAHRNNGVGKALYEFARSEIAASEPLSITCHVREGDEHSHRFAVSRGFSEAKRDYFSVLDLTKLDQANLDAMLARPVPEDIKIVVGTDVDTPEFRKGLHDLFEEVRKDLPRALPPTPLTFEQFDSAFLDPTFKWTCSMFAMKSGKPVAMCVTFESPTEGHLLQGLTGVSRELRGAGLGTILKARLVKQSIAEGYKSIGTDNDIRNKTMVAINDRLGFEKRPSIIQMMWGTNE